MSVVIARLPQLLSGKKSNLFKLYLLFSSSPYSLNKYEARSF